MIERNAIHIAGALALFVIVNWVGRHSYGRGYMAMTILPRTDEAPALNAAIRIGTPWAFLVLASAALYAAGLDNYVVNFYMVAAWYVLFRWAFNIAWGRTGLLNWPKEVAFGAVILLGSWFLYEQFIIRRVVLLPDPSTLANELWLIVTGFLFYVFNQVRFDGRDTARRKERYVEGQARKFMRQYGQEIRSETDNERLIALILAIMIYENFNRPFIARLLEYALFPLGKARTLGLMQVTTTTFMTSRESVRRGVRKIVSAWERERALYHGGIGEHEDILVASEIALDYNPDVHYASETLQIASVVEGTLFRGTTYRLTTYEPLLIEAVG